MVDVPSGTGGDLGSAIVASLADAAGGTVGVLKSYRATGWHAQISKITSSDRGYQAAAKVGLSANRKTLMDWLTERHPPSKANQQKIAEAYALMRGRWPEAIERAQMKIHGAVKIGGDTRERGGATGTNALVVEGSAGDWSEIRRMWEDGDVTADDIEEQWIEDVLEADLGESSEPWEFPGTSYTVEW